MFGNALTDCAHHPAGEEQGGHRDRGHAANHPESRASHGTAPFARASGLIRSSGSQRGQGTTNLSRDIANFASQYAIDALRNMR